jgi:hypothetical protein
MDSKMLGVERILHAPTCGRHSQVSEIHAPANVDWSGEWTRSARSGMAHEQGGGACLLVGLT